MEVTIKKNKNTMPLSCLGAGDFFLDQEQKSYIILGDKDDSVIAYNLECECAIYLPATQEVIHPRKVKVTFEID